MAFRAFLAKPFEKSHEDSYFEEFYKNIKYLYQKGEFEGDVVLVGNPSVSGCSLDALFIKNKAIFVIDFKNYAGSFDWTENGAWLIKESKVYLNWNNDNKQNPFHQLRHYRAMVNKYLYQILSGAFGKKKFEAFALVLFHGGKIKVDNSNLIPSTVDLWFKVVDLETVYDKLKNLTARNDFRLSIEEINFILDKLNLKQEYKLPSEIIAENQNQKQEKIVLPSEPVVSQITQPLSVAAETPKVQQEEPRDMNGESPDTRAVPPPQSAEEDAKNKEASAFLEAKNKLKAFVAEESRLTYFNDRSAKFTDALDEPIYYPKDVEIPSEKYGYGPFSPDKRPELLMFYYAVRAAVPENVAIDVVAGKYVEKYRFTDATTQESVLISFIYNKDFKFFRNKAQCNTPDSTLYKEVMALLSVYAPPKITNFEGYVLGPWLELLFENTEKYFQAAPVEIKAINYGINFKLARGKETLTCQVYYNSRLKITSALIQEYSSQQLFHDFKQLLI